MNERLTIPVEDLPLWMRRARQRVDWGIVIAAFFSLLVAWAFFVQDGLPHTNASENYVYRSANYATALREGRLYPRWTAPALYGYGAPIPHYYPSGAPYTVALIEMLFTNDTVLAVRLTYILSLTLAGTMMYVFVMRWQGASAGLLASILYVLSPYVGLTLPHLLGDLAGVIAMALLPGLLWSVHRLILANRAFDFLLVTVMFSALVVTEPRMAMCGAVITAMLLFWYRQHMFLVTLAGLTGLTLTTFYWLPAWLEPVDWQAYPFEPRTLRLTLTGLLSPLQRIDLNEMVPTPQFTLGSAGIVFALLGGMASRKTPLALVFLVSGAAWLILGVLVMPEQTWLMGPAVMCLAVGGGAAYHMSAWLPPDYRRLALSVLLLMILLDSVPVLLSPRWPAEFGPTDAATQIRYEQEGFGIAVLPAGSDIPTTIPADLPPNPSFISSYQTGDALRIPFNRSKRASLIASESHHDRYIVETNGPTIYNVLRADFAGWVVSVNGSPVPTETNPTTGLIDILVPVVRSGNLVIELGSTPLRRIGWLAAGVSALLLGLGVLLRLRNQQPVFYDNLHFISVREARLLFILAAGMLITVLAFATPDSPFTLHARPGNTLDNTHALKARVGGGLETISYAIPDDTTYNHGDTLDVMIAWRTIRPLVQNYSVRVYLRDVAQGLRWLPTPLHYPGGYPTRRWIEGRFVRDEYQIEIADTLPPGAYQIVIEVFTCRSNCTTADRLPFYHDGANAGPFLMLPPILTIN
jgi:hypothetical protein